MKPFDLKAAQAGEPIFVNMGSPFRVPDDGKERWELHRFVGLKANGDVVSETDSGACSLWTRPQEHVRMGPKTLTLYVEVCFHKGVFHGSWVSMQKMREHVDTPAWTYRYTTIEVDAP